MMFLLKAYTNIMIHSLISIILFNFALLIKARKAHLFTVVLSSFSFLPIHLGKYSYGSSKSLQLLFRFFENTLQPDETKPTDFFLIVVQVTRVEIESRTNAEDLLDILHIELHHADGMSITDARVILTEVAIPHALT